MRTMILSSKMVLKIIFLVIALLTASVTSWAQKTIENSKKVNSNKISFPKFTNSITDEQIQSVYSIKGPDNFDFVNVLVLKKDPSEKDKKYNLLFLGSKGSTNFKIAEIGFLDLDMMVETDRPEITVNHKGELLIKELRSKQNQGLWERILVFRFIKDELRLTGLTFFLYVDADSNDEIQSCDYDFSTGKGIRDNRVKTIKTTPIAIKDLTYKQLLSCDWK
ncbi:MAG: hypothetical protein L6Q37_08730 [Bdellovibrionaceae bacterium]|nr:hypothetical protein [Pseudobdellovibrionaceae bacterium]NUM58193.1 hypothetical protein [Pseudobdellovibrionaceae bacterium]